MGSYVRGPTTALVAHDAFENNEIRGSPPLPDKFRSAELEFAEPSVAGNGQERRRHGAGLTGGQQLQKRASGEPEDNSNVCAKFSTDGGKWAIIDCDRNISISPVSCISILASLEKMKHISTNPHYRPVRRAARRLSKSSNGPKMKAKCRVE